MNERVPVPRSPGRLGIFALATGAAFAVGMHVVDPSHASHVLGAMAGVTVVGAGAAEFVGQLWPERQRWVLYACWVGIAGSLGVLARFIAYAISRYA